ncbi:MAG TPA: FAD-binding and (Fe-S)-binding domain-containing protein [Propioniciclava tarda]|nr:FAD-binding and (Fe-S)-binding domain-containing protein [Propioniciclava tarda]HQD59626.1 FAD-binding and (Fe-S)-binding domain-containing protein [Propioniciclava tarda]
MCNDTLVSDLRLSLGQDQIKDRPLDLARMAHDASHYLLQPSVVVVARDGFDVAEAVRIASRHRAPVTFRSGGTSLSGQAQTDGVLIDTRKGFRGVEVLDAGARVRCEPGATVRSVNVALAPYGRALGPDPASEVACTIGGVVANNSSGMACGTTRNTYRTLAGIEVVLLSGTRIDTAAPDADVHLRHSEPALFEGLLRLRDRVRGNPDSMRIIAHQFSMKNTMGYGINAFVDFDSPADILAHLMVGSEGTLGFILAATFDTIPAYKQLATSLLVFDRIDGATAALPALVDAGAATAELMDAASLRVAQNLATVVPALVGLNVEAHTALLVEAQCETPGELADRVAALSGVVGTLGGLVPLAKPYAFSTDPQERAQAWVVRKGLYTAVAGARPSGSTALLEDVVVPMPALTETVGEIQRLCGRYAYDDAVIFGHAKDANLHFMINPDLRDPAQLDAYARFSDELVDLILAADGSLKAEHGTGRIMAPFVERQYGTELYGVMRDVKALFDPEGVLNPGVIITSDAQLHLRDLKVPEVVDPAVDRCVECGYCEPVCPSRDLTTTPRQRIALMRELKASDADRRAAIEADFTYDAVQTCAADSLCLLNCPVSIDTGKVMKGFRAEAQSPVAQKVALQLAENWGSVVRGLRLGMEVASVVPSPVLSVVTDVGRRVVSTDLLYRVGDDLPGPGVSRKTRHRRAPGEVVLFASCLNEIFGSATATRKDKHQGAPFAFLALCDRAGVKAQIPEGIEGLCCGTVWRSKGLTDGLGTMAERTASVLLTATRDGEVPVVTDASSCTHGLHELASDLVKAGKPDLAERFARIEIIDSVAYAAQHLLPHLRVTRKLGSAVLHPTCSDRHAGDLPHLLACAQACADTVIVPDAAGCCAFAGDRGMLHPELTASATRAEASEVRKATYDAYLSSNRTCELGMTRATGQTYRHVLELLAELTA